MKRYKLNRKCLYAIVIIFGIALQGSVSQNIVTVFGQEKIEKTDEGEVFHKFKKGLFLPGAVNPGTLFNAQDMIAWMYATGRYVTPQAGDSLTYSYPNMVQNREQAQARERMMRNMGMTPPAQWKWSETEVDSVGVFRNPFLRSACLYTAYESPREQVSLLETTGGTRVYINGFPHEGDHYDFGYTLIPVRLKKGLNEFIHTPGRFGRVAAKLVKPDKPVMFTKRDMTVPDIIIGEEDPKWAAIRVINATEKTLRGLTVRATLASGQQTEHKTDDIMPLAVRKLKYRIPAAKNGVAGDVNVTLELLDKSGKVIDRTEITLRSVSPSTYHERTFVSRIDGSVQYYSVAPAVRNTPGETKAMVLSVHGAGVEARSQARSYSHKEWTDIVAATNRRPYGFNWEDWGRIDALETLEEAKRVFRPDLSKIYLTGHSMGGHGTWVLGTTYPDKFAAIAPCASYPDIITYGRRPDEMHSDYPFYKAFERSANAGRILSIIQNLKQSGVYIFHGDADRVVPTEQARKMRGILGEFHPDFCYYEYPGGEHWFGNISMDWPPIFEFFSRHAIPSPKEVKTIDFHTASPSVSASDYWIRVEQQIEAYQLTNVKVMREKDTVFIQNAGNVAILELDIPSSGIDAEAVTVYAGSQTLRVPGNRKALLEFDGERWSIKESLNLKHKYSGRNGGFKQVFDNHVVFVYATGGNRQENEWYRNKARFDAETFYYRGNGSIDVIPDTEFSLSGYSNRNVVIYGNKNNNSAWPLLLKDCPVQVSRNEIKAGDTSFTGDDLGVYFVYPHPANDHALVGVIAGTGLPGMRATSPNNYISGITGFPDIMIYRADVLRDGLPAVEIAGFFNNDWTLTREDM
ncbi:MAG: prolyl oligopeptidase family serine peptidase [Tannerella sp.]|jgi:pimeloyl-ACP methyl ester carboxylesterase|nr:prolyl oligopeptidase family serine peptidase [Tannerella sp.]